MNLNENKEKIYQMICDDLYVPMKIKEMAILLQIPKERRGELEYILEQLIQEEKIQITKKGRYQKAQAIKYVGTFISNARGFGFVDIEDQDEDIFISESNTMNAMSKDKVEVTILSAPAGKRREGKVIKIIEHGTNLIVGYYEKNKNFGFVRPDDQRINQDIFIDQKYSMGAVTGHKVVVEITKYQSAKNKPEGKIVEIIGHVNDPGTDILSIVKAFGITVDFPKEVLDDVMTIPDEVLVSDYMERRDLRQVAMITIDGEDAKDLDDAVSLSRLPSGYELGVHIADVSEYVKENENLDKEAKERGTSVYLVDRVIPMLPHKLSNGICSLNQGVDRLALSCIMNIDETGKILSHEIVESVINVNHRMTYTQVKEILENPIASERETFKDQVPMIEEMGKLASLLRENRKNRGSIDFDFPETKMKLDDMGRPVSIQPYDRNVATKLIEDFMLAANETVAEAYFWKEIPFVYRTHEKPDPEKIAKLKTFIQNFGYILKGDKDTMHPMELQKLLTSIDGTSQEALISRITLRSMRQARYTTDNLGHFGLAAKYYCHFTSPIRRYPDLQIHRIIKDDLNNKMTDKRMEHYDR
ncbi:MAG: ribonuclease R, partial [Lachnospiraceae bacterium]|nr:ribonuclease R [Lachnospiraceae bacterium]